jgi:hypothetical protein
MTIDQLENECSSIDDKIVFKTDMFGNIYLCHWYPLTKDLMEIGGRYYVSELGYDHKNETSRVVVIRKLSDIDDYHNYRKIIKDY